MASRMASEIWSATLSGWPMVTDSLVNRCVLRRNCGLTDAPPGVFGGTGGTGGSKPGNSGKLEGFYSPGTDGRRAKGAAPGSGKCRNVLEVGPRGKQGV